MLTRDAGLGPHPTLRLDNYLIHPPPPPPHPPADLENHYFRNNVVTVGRRL